MDSIYLDCNATTPIRPEVVEAMDRCHVEGYANPASQHAGGQRARRALEEAREGIAGILGADLACPQPQRLIFTGGGTAANNLAVLGIGLASDGPHPPGVVISAIEHSSVIQPAEHLLEQGWRLDTLGVDSHGVVQVNQLPQLLTDRTRLVSVMAANHEIGTLQPIEEFSAICTRAGVPLHTDAVQMAGKLPIDFRAWGVAAMSVAAHKFQGPSGIGALIVRHGAALEPILFGGHQQDGLWPGTESVALAVGMWTALKLWQQEQDAQLRRLTALRDGFEEGLKTGWPEVLVHGADAPRLPQTSNVAFPGLDGQVLFTALDMAGVACSVGSACSSGSSELSPTLLATGASSSLVSSSLRFSLGAATTEGEVDEAVRRILDVTGQLRG